MLCMVRVCRRYFQMPQYINANEPLGRKHKKSPERGEKNNGTIRAIEYRRKHAGFATLRELRMAQRYNKSVRRTLADQETYQPGRSGATARSALAHTHIASAYTRCLPTTRTYSSTRSGVSFLATSDRDRKSTGQPRGTNCLLPARGEGCGLWWIARTCSFR